MEILEEAVPETSVHANPEFVDVKTWFVNPENPLT